MWIPKEAMLIRRRCLLEEIWHVSDWRSFTFIAFLILPSCSYHILLKYVHLKDYSRNSHSYSYIKSTGRYLVLYSMSYLIQNFCNPPLKIFLQNAELSNTFTLFSNMTILFHLCSLISAVAFCIVQFDWHLE